MQRVPPPVWLPPSTSIPNQVLQSTGSGSGVKWGNINTSVSNSGSGNGITQLTGDVIAGPGSGSVISYLDLIQGITLQTTGASAPSPGNFLTYTSVITPRWQPSGGTPTLGSQLYWTGVAWVSSTSPTGNAQVLIWNSGTSTWVPKSIYGDITLTNNGQTTVSALQNTTLNVSGASAPVNGNFLTYSSLIGGGSWQPGGGTAFTGSIMYWNGTAWVSTSAPTTGSVWKWNGSSYVASTPLVSGDTAGGDLTGTYPNPTLNAVYFNSTNIGSSTQIPVLTIDTKGRITNASTVSPASSGQANNMWKITNTDSPITLTGTGFTNYYVALNGVGQRTSAGAMYTTITVGGVALMTAPTYVTATSLNQNLSMSNIQTYSNSGSFTINAPVLVGFSSGSATAIIIGIN